MLNVTYHYIGGGEDIKGISLENFTEPDWISNDNNYEVSFQEQALESLKFFVENNYLEFYTSLEFTEVRIAYHFFNLS